MYAFILGLVGSLAARVFIGAGITVVAFTGLSVLSDFAINKIQTALSGSNVAAGVGVLANLGIFDALGIIVGAHVAAASIVALKSTLTISK